MKWRGKKEEGSWLTVLCCRRPNKVSCKNHSNTPGISMHTFLKEAKRKQKQTTFAMIHRLACQWNTLPCAPSISKDSVSAEVCLLGHQWIQRGFTLREVQYCQYTRGRKIYWTLITQEMRGGLQIDLSRETFLDVSLGSYRKTSLSKIPLSKKVNFFSDCAGLFEICFRSSKMTDPQPFPTGWTYFTALSRSTKTCQAQTKNKLHSPREIISTVSDFPYKITEKCL